MGSDMTSPDDQARREAAEAACLRWVTTGGPSHLSLTAAFEEGHVIGSASQRERDAEEIRGYQEMYAEQCEDHHANMRTWDACSAETARLRQQLDIAREGLVDAACSCELSKHTNNMLICRRCDALKRIQEAVGG